MCLWEWKAFAFESNWIKTSLFQAIEDLRKQKGSKRRKFIFPCARIYSSCLCTLVILFWTFVFGLELKLLTSWSSDLKIWVKLHSCFPGYPAFKWKLWDFHCHLDQCQFLSEISFHIYIYVYVYKYICIYNFYMYICIHLTIDLLCRIMINVIFQYLVAIGNISWKFSNMYLKND